MNKLPIASVAALVVLLTGCMGAQQRGMQGSAYVSTSRPAISMKAADLPLITGGEGNINLNWAGMAGGVPVRTWVAAYGKGNVQSPLAVVALAELPQGWYWDGDERRPFSVDNGVEVFNDVAYQAGTYIVDGKNDPFAELEGATDAARPVRWLARGFAARYNFNDTKIILEYREPLPENLAAEQSLSVGQTDQLRAFEERARKAFVVGPLPTDLGGIKPGYARNVLWQYMDQRFVGTVSKYEPLGVL